MAMKMPALRASRAFVKEHCGDAGAVSLALDGVGSSGGQRRTWLGSCGQRW